MIDYFMRYNNEAAARNDAKALQAAMGIPITEEWQRQHTLTDVKAWRVSLDVVDPETGHVTHTYFTGWFCIVALNYREQVLLDSPALQFCLDRTACNQGKKFIIKNNIGSLIQDVACEPIFAGSTYPVGGYN